MSGEMLRIDFETQSLVDLPSAGAHTYAMDPSTKILMMSWAFDDEPVQLWLPGDLFPERIIDHIKRKGLIGAFNAQFERLIMWYVLCPDFGVPEPAMEQFICTAAQARANNLPGNLEDCARYLKTTQQKDNRGKTLMRLFSMPQSDGAFLTPADRPDEWADFCDYCIQDTETERAIAACMRPLTLKEREDYWVNERINDRGLRIDRELAAAAIHYASEEQANCVEHVARLTGGKVTKVRGKFITQWVFDRLPHEPEPLHQYMLVPQGEDKPDKLTFDRNARERLLNFRDALNVEVAEVIEYADFAQASSTGKFAAMLAAADPEDDRVRGCYILNGAASSGRYSAKRLQPHNMPRKTTKRPRLTRYRMIERRTPADIMHVSGDNMMQTLKGLLRFSIVAEPGHTFVCGDWAQIEGRVCPWLAHGINGTVDHFVNKKLAIYADPSRDVYCETATDILGRAIEPGDPERQGYGKVPELSLGFGGGVGAFFGMAANYGVNLPRSEVEDIVRNWRDSNPWAQPLWYGLFDAARQACNDPGVPYTCGRVSYLFQEDYLDGTLWCLLPSGRLLCYPETTCEWKENKFGNFSWEITSAKAAWMPKAHEKKWPRIALWPGLLAENCTQAVAADVLRDCLAFLVMEYDAPVVGHTHDEVLLEVPKHNISYFYDLLESAMLQGPPWAEGLPLAAELWTGARYRK